MNDASAVDRAVSRAMEFLCASQLAYGEIPLSVSHDPGLQNAQFDSSPSATAFLLYSLRFVEHFKVGEMRQQAVRFLVEEMEPPGVWRFWSSRNTMTIDPDMDDTCYISFVLRTYHPHIALGSNVPLILSNRNEAGLFYTWFRPLGSKNDVDSVVNANVLLYLAMRPETASVVDYLNGVIKSGAESESYWYYTSNAALYYAVSRAFYHGTAGLGECREAIVERIYAQQKPDGSFGNDLDTAYCICTLLNLGEPDRRSLDLAIRHLVRRQSVAGGWAPVAAATGPEPPAKRAVWWGSEEFTTVVSVEALARYGIKG